MLGGSLKESSSVTMKWKKEVWSYASIYPSIFHYIYPYHLYASIYSAYDEVDGDSKMESSSISKRDARQRSKTPYKNQLMLSEWLVEIPTDFQENWYMVVCPVAKRCLVLSANGSTTVYSRSGHHMKQFPSHLPGGSRKLSPGKKDYCILDCLFEETSSTFYVLDIMCWRGHPVYDSDTEFRFYWLNAKMTENGDDLVVQTRTNPYKFIPLQHYSCSFDTLVQIFSSSWSILVDGLLFFHKKSHYFLGRSPLVLWLKPHMVTDILGLPVSQEFLDCVPVLSDVKMETDKRGNTSQKTREGMETEKDEVKQPVPTEDMCT